MIVLGIDPGIEIVGFAVADIQGNRYTLLSCGVIRTSSKLATAERLTQIRDDLQQILAQFPEIAVAGVEELFFSKNVSTAAAVWQARGVIIELLQRVGIPQVIDLKPNQIKTAVCGNGAAKKPEVQKMVSITFQLPQIPEPDDAADAAAIAITAAQYARIS